jgi:ribose transport system substrate-binding protein
MASLVRDQEEKMKSTPMRVLLVAASMAMLVIGLAACGGGGSSSSSEPTEASAPPKQSETASEKTEEGGADEGGGKQAAEAFIAPYVGHPSPFPVTEKLNEIPKGSTVAYMDCGTPICSQVFAGITPAAEMLGINLERIKAGSSASTISAAFDSVVAKKPDGVIAMADPVTFWSKQLKELEAAEVPVLVEGIGGAEAEEYGVHTGLSGSAAANALGGELLANYVAAKMTPNASVVFYEVAGVGVTEETAEAFVSTLESACPECSVRTVPISPETLGNTAPQVVVSDLQANPDTNVGVFSSGQILLGLPDALHAAGIDIETLDYGPEPSNLQYLKEGKETAALATDFPVIAWTLIDQISREMIGQELTGLEAEGIGVNQFLTQKEITFDPTKGWTGYPDFVERFAKLWGVEG